MKGIPAMYMSAKITAFLIEQKIISDEDREIYEYGFELLLADLFNFSVILLTGGIAHQLWPTVLYILIFVGLRSVCGGYHAKTHLRCHIGTIGVYILFLLLLSMQTVVENKWLLLWGDFFAAIPIILFAPIPHANKPLSKTVRRRNRIRSIILFFLLFLFALLLGYFERQESAVISLALWIVSLCMIPAIDIQPFTQRRKKT